ncbi:hypothetical protein [Pseudomonas weihenstephanensis]|uniref:hypothetical protein n=1 Tax=Pseudomonas weihenstephanensis TaxID=1608994 RepID=UPI00193B56B4|nr:hypothetical protein [Pseudomonas weihenstephanensis]MBM1191530.1 hypothetical protein [Pseudomonas weihenstephanensis]
MSNPYAGKNGSFSAQIRAFADRTKGAIDVTMRDIIINIGNSVITMSPVGNPSIWKINKISHEYNQAVAEHNEILRKNPQNFDKRGYLKRGLKLNDGMGIRTPQGYIGGRFRGNWMFSIGSPDASTVDQVDPGGSRSMARIVNGALQFNAGETAYITNSLPYAVPLEYGHSTQAPSGMVRITLANFQKIVEEAIRKNQE